MTADQHLESELDEIWGTLWEPFDTVLRAKPPAVLYHYATPASLVGIVTSKVLWASHIRFLNDAQEANHGVNFFDRQLQRALDEDRLPRSLAPFDDLYAQDGMLASAKVGLYVASLSEVGDDVNQWRAYCPTGGYAIGFDGRILDQRVRENRVGEVHRVVYSPDEKELIARNVIDAANIVWRSTRARSSKTLRKYIREELREIYATILCVFKDPAFVSEREWRIVAAGERSGPGRVKFRATPSTIVPYAEIPLLSANDSIVTRVVIGPNPHRHSAREGVSELLYENDIRCKKYPFSRVPYRSL